LHLSLKNAAVFKRGNAAEIAHAAHEHFPLIALFGSLFVVAGVIPLNVKGEATPPQNVVFLLIGGSVAILVGTTSASLVMIRPLIPSGSHIPKLASAWLQPASLRPVPKISEVSDPGYTKLVR
jgi:hypothetical protein